MNHESWKQLSQIILSLTVKSQYKFLNNFVKFWKKHNRSDQTLSFPAEKEMDFEFT